MRREEGKRLSAAEIASHKNSFLHAWKQMCWTFLYLKAVASAVGIGIGMCRFLFFLFVEHFSVFSSFAVVRTKK